MLAIYCRQSLEKADSLSIDGQVDMCKKEIASNEEYKTYIDKGFSGKDTHRPAFNEMMVDIKRGLINRVVVYKIDRISRNILDFANIMTAFQEYGVEFVSTVEKFDTNSPMGKAMMHIIAVFSQLERENIQKRVLDNYYYRGKKGFFLGGQVPYGYKKEKTQVEGIKTSKLIENIDQSVHVMQMFHLYAETDMSLGAIAKYLNEKSIPTAKDKMWDSSKISTILRNPVYVRGDSDVYLYYRDKGCIIANELSDFTGKNGCYLFGKRKPNERKFTNVENHILTISLHEGLVDGHTWLKCQRKLDKNKQIKNTGKGKHSWLTNVKCAKCGYSASVVVSNGKYKYFYCKGKANTKMCEGFTETIHVNIIENFVKKRLIEKIKQIQKSKSSPKISNNNMKTNKLKMQLIEIDDKINNLINQLAEGASVTIKYINQKIADLDSEKQTILEEIKKNTVTDESVDKDKMLEMANNWNKIQLQEKKKVCQAYIDKILIEEGVINIMWKGDI